MLACAVSWLLYRGLVIIPLHRLFSVTNGLIALLAAGMAGQAAAILHSADLLPGWGEQLWNTSFILADDSFLGRSLHALVGYSARPSGIQLAAWLATLLVLVIASRAMSKPRAAHGGRRRGGGRDCWPAARRPAPMTCPRWCSTTTASSRTTSRCRPT